MRKFTLISATFLLAFAGCTCGQGWRPNIFTRLHNRIHGVGNMGEPCDAGCSTAAPAAPAAEYAPVNGCTTCGNGVTSQYGEYNGQVISEGTVYNSTTPMTYSAQPIGEAVRPQPNRP